MSIGSISNNQLNNVSNSSLSSQSSLWCPKRPGCDHHIMPFPNPGSGLPQLFEKITQMLTGLIERLTTAISNIFEKLGGGQNSILGGSTANPMTDMWGGSSSPYQGTNENPNFLDGMVDFGKKFLGFFSDIFSGGSSGGLFSGLIKGGSSILKKIF